MTGRSILFTVCLLCTIACQKDQPLSLQEAFTGLEEVDNRLHALFNKFQAEAAQRGIQVDYTRLNIEGSIEDIPDEDVAGSCRWGGNHQSVTIDTRIWNSNNPIIREVVTFHELGHCVLNLGHDDAVINGDVCKSLMNSGLVGCRTLYSDNRNYYLDELFEKTDD